MKPNSCPFLARRLPAILALLTIAPGLLWAEDVYVTSFKGTVGTTDVTPCPPSCVTGSVSASGSTASSSATPVPVIPASGRRVRFGFGAGCTWSVTPMDIVLTPAAGSPNYTFTSLQHVPGVYKIYVTKGNQSSASSNIVVELTATGGDLADLNGNAATAISVTAFQRSEPMNVWIPIGFITNNMASPTLTFTHVAGAINSSPDRWYMDAVRFEYIDPCTGVSPELGVDGPLVAGQTFVNVSGVVDGATNIAVYADNVEIGQTNFAAGFAAGSVTVPTTALVKGASITARQIKNGCVGTPPATGPIVGGGANPKVRALLGCWKNSGLAGPIGANTTTGLTNNYFLSATGLRAGYNTAPLGGRSIPAGACWYTATFDHAGDAGLYATSGVLFTNTDRFCALEGLVFSIDDTDSGPYDIYVDLIMNGDVVIEDFEGYDAGAEVTFSAPNAAGTPTPALTYLSAPNSSAVSQNYAFEGTNSCRIQWQFGDTNNTRWAHILANGAAGKRYPQLDISKPITVRYLVLPPGVTTDHKFSGTVSQITGHTPAYLTGSNNLTVTVAGPASYTYQWSWNEIPIPDATTSSLGIGIYGLSPIENGVYSVAVSDGTCTEIRSATVTVIDPVPTITNQPAHAIVNQGSTGPVMNVGADGHVAAGYPLYYQWRFNQVDIPGQTTDTLSFPAGAQLSDVGSYDVVVFNGYGMVTSIVQTVAVVPAGIAAGTGTGLRGQYWTTRYSTNAFSGAPTLTRVDATVNFAWDTGSPDPAISADNFSARWAGQVQALGTDTYTFHTISDDGVRLWVNGQLLIDNWTAHSPTTNSATLALTGTQKYDVLLEYFERTGGATAKLYWSTASGSIGFEPVPMTQLYPATTTVVPTLTYTLDNGTNLVFNWGPGSANLVWASNVEGPYTNVIYDVTSPWTVTLDSAAARFFRLQVQ